MAAEVENNQAPEPVVSQVEVKRPRYFSKRVIIIAVAAVLLLAAVGGTVLIRQSLAEADEARQTAIKRSESKAKGFETDTQSYRFVQLNTAIEYANTGKCIEARGIFKEVEKDPNGVSEMDVKAFKAKIDKLC